MPLEVAKLLFPEGIKPSTERIVIEKVSRIARLQAQRHLLERNGDLTVQDEVVTQLLIDQQKRILIADMLDQGFVMIDPHDSQGVILNLEKQDEANAYLSKKIEELREEGFCDLALIDFYEMLEKSRFFVLFENIGDRFPEILSSLASVSPEMSQIILSFFFLMLRLVTVGLVDIDQATIHDLALSYHQACKTWAVYFGTHIQKEIEENALGKFPKISWRVKLLFLGETGRQLLRRLRFANNSS